jgi:preprotein translocase subunit YajC
MSLLSALGIATAYAVDVPAAGAAAQQHGSVWGMLWLPLLLIVVFYFLLIRPQSKRAKEHRALIEAVSVGDEVITTGGIIGRVARLKDNFVVLELTKGMEVTMQKGSIASVLPKGTIDSI